MKFRHKIYLCALIVFLIGIDAGAFALLHKSYDLNRQMDIQRGVHEYVTVSETLNYITGGIPGSTPAISSDTMRTIIYAFSQKNPGTALEVYHDGNLLYSNTSYFEGRRAELESSSPAPVYRKLDGRLRLFVGGPLAQPGYQLVVSRDSGYLTEYYQSLLFYFVGLSILLSILLSFVLFLLLRRLTRPIEQLSGAAREIANGHYSRRVAVKSQDEIGQLAGDFNKMAAAVSEKINELVEMNLEKEHFVSSLTHELKTPIATIKGYCEFLQNANCTGEEKALALHYIYEHIYRLELLTGRLLELLRLKSNAFEPQELSVPELFSSTQKLAAAFLQEKNLTLVTDPQTQTLRGDSILLQTAVLNLVENAAKASASGSEIILRSRRGEDQTILEVADQGCGIPEQDAKHVCEEFYRVDKSRARKSGGLGLGLSICRQIMNLHGGMISLDSAPGEGTTVRLSFPDIRS